MDLKAYAQIEDLEVVAKANGIDCPRLRGYRLMSKEESNVIENYFNAGDEVHVLEDLCAAHPFWSANPDYVEFSSWTDYIKKYYISKDRKIRWDRIHGWKRRVLKTAIHNEKVKCKKQLDAFNKYVGRDDILYIHARIGGGNWPLYSKYVVNEPWFIEKVDDSFDSTYCDIYARIDPNTVKKLEESKDDN